MRTPDTGMIAVGAVRGEDMDQPPASLFCELCATSREPILSFQLIRRVTVEGRQTTRASGRIRLCPRCARVIRARSPRRRGKAA